MARREMYVTAGELRKGDIIDMQEVITKRNRKDGMTNLLLQSTVNGNLIRVNWRSGSYHEIVRYTNG